MAIEGLSLEIVLFKFFKKKNRAVPAMENASRTTSMSASLLSNLGLDLVFFFRLHLHPPLKNQE